MNNYVETIKDLEHELQAECMCPQWGANPNDAQAILLYVQEMLEEME